MSKVSVDPESDEIKADNEPTVSELITRDLHSVPPELRSLVKAVIKGKAYSKHDDANRALKLRQLTEFLSPYFSDAFSITMFMTKSVHASLHTENTQREPHYPGEVVHGFPAENAHDDNPQFKCGFREVERIFEKLRPRKYKDTLEMLTVWKRRWEPDAVLHNLKRRISECLIVVDPVSNAKFIMTPNGSYREINPAVLKDHAEDRSILGWTQDQRLNGTLNVEKFPEYKRLCEHNTQLATRVLKTMATTNTYYEPATRTLFVAMYKLFPIKPAFNTDCDRFVTALGGSKSERLKDWLATYWDLSRPTSALGLRGKPLTGKNAFVALLASVWNGTPIDIKNLIRPFNDAVQSSPIVHAEEGFPFVGPSNEEGTAYFRKLITATQVELHAKYKNVEKIDGSLRVVITYNNVNQLPFGRSDLEDIDRQAIERRLLDIRVPDESRDALEAAGGWDTVQKWQREGTFAAYVFWLAKKRSVNPGHLSVDGDASSLVAECLARNGRNSNVLCTLASIAADPSRISKSERSSIIVSENELWVNSALLAGRTWDSYAPGEEIPKQISVGCALGNVATGKQTMGSPRARYHRIPVEALARYSDVSEEALRAGLRSLESPNASILPFSAPGTAPIAVLTA